MQVLLTAYPQGSESLDWEYATPLNLAIREGQEDIASHLIDECPHALQVQNINGELPIDIAMRNSSSLHLFMKIVQCWPESCKYLLANIRKDENVDKWEWSKIELCFQVVSTLLERKNHSINTEAIRCEYLPLHSALRLTSNISLINRVLHLCPDMISKKDSLGRYPLHVAAEYCKDDSGLVEKLLKLFPQAASEIDHMGRLPLHIALIKQRSISDVKPLLFAYPRSAVQKCTLNNARLKGVPPLFLASEFGCSIDVLYHLAQLDPNLYSCDE